MGVVLICAAQAVQAKSPNKNQPRPEAATWDKEPTSFLGFDLGKPLRTDLSFCPVEPRELAYADQCLQGSGDYLKLWKAPDLGFPYRNDIHLRDKRVQSITLTVMENNYAALKSLLISRYGPPRQSSTASVKTLAGGQFTSEECIWDGHNVYIRLVQRYDKIDESVLFVQDHDLQAG